MIYEHDVWYKRSDRDAIFSSHAPIGNYKKVTVKALQRHVAGWEARLSVAKPRFRQLRHLIDKFGGILTFSLVIGVHPNTILYNWMGITKDCKPATNKMKRPPLGLVSFHYLIRLMQASRYFGILLKPEDLFIDLIDNGVVKNSLSHPEIRSWIKQMNPNMNHRELEHTIALLIQPELK